MEQASGERKELEGRLDLRVKGLTHGGFAALRTSLGPPYPSYVRESGHQSRFRISPKSPI